MPTTMEETRKHLVVGLGNPGSEYRDTRHNAGFRVADLFAERHGIALTKSGFSSLYGTGRAEGGWIAVAKPTTFMNRSGTAVSQLMGFFQVSRENLLVVHDDIDLPFGTVKIKAKGGHGGHNGIRSIMEALGGGDFFRIRVGVGRPPDERPVAGHVLSGFDAGQRQAIEDLWALAAEAVEVLLREGSRAAMNRFNNRSVIAAPSAPSPTDQ
ncbi:MAG: aminoacyl-tRNA hydrolase [Thermodesulfobacteriota bacterium]